MEITEIDWLARYGETIRKLQEFEQALLALLLTVRDEDWDPLSTGEDFRKLLAGDLGSTGGQVLGSLRRDHPQVVSTVIRNTFGAHPGG